MLEKTYVFFLSEPNFFFQISDKSCKKITKSIKSQKLRIAQKRSFMQKMNARLIPIYPVNLASFFSKKLHFWGAFWACLGTCGGVCISLIVTGPFEPKKMSLFEEGGGLHIVSEEKPEFCYCCSSYFKPSIRRISNKSTANIDTTLIIKYRRCFSRADIK